jgi:GTP-sensing pleiotropic transcriptional regulator CodY
VIILTEATRKIKNERINIGNNKLIKSEDRVGITRAVVILALIIYCMGV